MEQAHYIELKKQVGEALQSQAAQHDKAILTLAAGALALSLTFIKDIAPTPDGWTISLLAWSWGCFIGSVCLTLVSFQVSVCAFRRFDEILNIQQSKPDADASTLKNHWGTVTLVLNRLSLVMFIAGTIVLSVSSHHGLKVKAQKERDVSQKSSEIAGAVPPSPPVAQLPAIPPVTPSKPGHGAIPASPPVRPPQAPPPPPAPPKKSGG
jgi:hypothetical protein